MMPFSPMTQLDESEKQLLRDNKGSEIMRIVRKLIQQCYEQVEHGYLYKTEHKPEELLVLKGEKLMAVGLYNTLLNASSDVTQVPDKKKPLTPVR
jgi:hypothetical protein